MFRRCRPLMTTCANVSIPTNVLHSETRFSRIAYCVRVGATLFFHLRNARERGALWALVSDGIYIKTRSGRRSD